jgi:hypothetical protein
LRPAPEDEKGQGVAPSQARANSDLSEWQTGVEPLITQSDANAEQGDDGGIPT